MKILKYIIFLIGGFLIIISYSTMETRLEKAETRISEMKNDSIIYKNQIEKLTLDNQWKPKNK